MSDMVKCQYCGKEFSKMGVHKHETFCKMNPDNIGDEPEVKQETKVVVADEKELKKAYNTMRKRLSECPKKDIFIVPDEVYKKGTCRPVAVNGVTYSIPVGIHFKGDDGVPEPIYDAYMYSYEATEKAHSDAKQALTKEIITIQ